MKNLFEIGQPVIFTAPLDGELITTKILSFFYSELEKTYLYRIECRHNTFWPEYTLQNIETRLKNEDRYSLEKIDRILDEETQMSIDREYM
jgi:hypothetical protein